jgi:hypothetical protein
VSEVNWPLEGQGVYSPVGSPYVAPGVRKNDPSISEDQYADFMLRYLCIAIASGFVERVYWWRLAARGFGLVDDSGLEWRRRPAFEMLSTLLRKVSSAGCRVSSDRKGGRQQDLRRFRFESDGNTDFELAYSVDREFDAAAAFSDARFEDALGNPVDAEGFKIGGRPVYVFRND